MSIQMSWTARGDQRIHSAAVHCDGCGKAAERQAADTPERAERLAVKSAEAIGFAGYGRGRQWLCLVCRLQHLPAHLQRLFPQLLTANGLTVPPEEKPERPAPRKASRRRTQK